MATRVQAVAFWKVKDGNHEWEWEDGAAYVVDRWSGRARCIVVDGAAEAFDPIRWADHIVETFVGKRGGGPDAVEGEELGRWFTRLQDEWADGPAVVPTGEYGIFEQHKAQSGSFATMLCCEIDGLGGAAPRWTAASLGDTVLFHVRDGALLHHFPPLQPADFGLAPDGVFTSPTELQRMCAALSVRSAPLRTGDRLYIATDALADWLLRTGPDVWGPLRDIDHPEVFAQLVADRRAAGELKNDDVTLLRIEIAAGDPDTVQVAR